MDGMLVLAAHLDSEVGLGFDICLGILPVGRPGTEAARPNNLGVDLLDTVAVADPDNNHGAGLHLDMKDPCGTADRDIQKFLVAETLHGPLPLVDEPLVPHRNRSVLVHSD